MPQASARRLPFGHPRICSQITGDSALQCWSGCEISPRVHHFCSRPCGRGDGRGVRLAVIHLNFYSRPCGRGDGAARRLPVLCCRISTHAPAGGATSFSTVSRLYAGFLLTPLREGRRGHRYKATRNCIHFYSRPCGRGDDLRCAVISGIVCISTHAPAGGATDAVIAATAAGVLFLLTPLREGRLRSALTANDAAHFYSRPCGRGDGIVSEPLHDSGISTHAPAGGATRRSRQRRKPWQDFYSRPCGRGDACAARRRDRASHFYSRPCGRGDRQLRGGADILFRISTHAPAGGATLILLVFRKHSLISTHAPAGGATQQGYVG